MSRNKIGASFLISILASLLLVFVLTSCGGTGDTDGGTGAEAATDNSNQFTGGSSLGGSIELLISSLRIATGTTTGFFVRLLDGSGLPLEGILVECQTEVGIAII